MVYLQEYTERRKQRLSRMGTTCTEKAPKAKPHREIVKGKQRDSLIDKIFDNLSDWHLSWFEYEGSVKSAVRSGLCLAGHQWEPSDLEAEALVQAALKRMGAVRPSWIEGQPEYTIAKDHCQNYLCRGPLSDEDISHGRKFCSDSCRDFVMLHRQEIIRRHESLAAKQASYDAWLAGMRNTGVSRQCLNPACGKTYRSPWREQKHCSYECSSTAQQNPERHRQCANPACGKSFVDHQVKGKKQLYCSLQCRKADWPTVELNCLNCQKPFEAKATTGRAAPKYCCDDCRIKYNRVRTLAKRKAEKKSAEIIYLTPKIFDSWFRKAA